MTPSQDAIRLQEIVLEIRADVKELMERVGRIDHEVGDVSRTTADHETRLRRMERRLYSLPGLAFLGVLVAAISVLATLR